MDAETAVDLSKGKQRWGLRVVTWEIRQLNVIYVPANHKRRPMQPRGVRA